MSNFEKMIEDQGDFCYVLDITASQLEERGWNLEDEDMDSYDFTIRYNGGDNWELIATSYPDGEPYTIVETLKGFGGIEEVKGLMELPGKFS